MPVPSSAPDDSSDASSDTGGGAPLAPRWGHVPPGSFDAITRPETDEEPLDVPEAPDADESDVTPGPRRASYTWLQMLVLALVAFVLGFIVWLLIVKGSPESAPAGAWAPATITSSSGSSWPHQGEL